MRGVDISHYQKGLTIRQIRDAGCDFAILKVTEGARLKDAAAFDFYREAFEMDFPVGCYCYSHAVAPEDARSEARFLLDTVKGFPMPCGVFLDIEEPKQLGLSEETLKAIAAAWCEAVYGAGYLPGIYGGEAAVWAKLRPDELQDGCLVWIARYGKEPGMPCDLWQSSDSGCIGGVTVDTDEARSERFRAMVEGGMPARQDAPPQGETDGGIEGSGALRLLAGYLLTDAFRQGFTDYIKRTEVSR